MIDIDREELLTLARAARYVPRRRGRKVHGTTLWRWCVRGYQGLRLEAVRTPAGWATTRQAVQRFLAELARREHERRRRTEERLDEASRR